MQKVYVDVVAMYNAEGTIMPLSFIWTDGTVFEIDKVLEVTRAASLKVGGTGLRYKVRFSNDDLEVWNRVRYLFLEKGASPERWFLEAK